MGSAEVFTCPVQGEALAVVVSSQLIFAFIAFGVPEVREFGEEGRVVLGICVFFAVVCLLTMFQRVTIDGTFVQVQSFLTCFRWLRFDASEIREVRFVQAAGEAQVHHLMMTLDRAPHRRWHRVRIHSDATPLYNGGIDVPVFLALMRALALCQPDLAIQDLPPDYRGVLAPPRAMKAQAPAPRGKARKRERTAAAERANRKERSSKTT